MLDNLSETGSVPELLLESFTQKDFEDAKASLLARYRLWHGILITDDGTSIITPDDVETFKEQADDMSEQTLLSDYEKEQIKILVVLIYLLISADKEAAPDSEEAAVDFAKFPHTRNFIIRKILYQAKTLTFHDIETLLQHQNKISSSDDTQTSSASSILTSDDNISFVLRGYSGNYSADIVTEKQISEADDADETTGQYKIPKPRFAKKEIILRDQERESLLSTMEMTTLDCEANITAASYKGYRREDNEDGILVLPDHNQVTVMDGMGAYKNGTIVRDHFIDIAQQYAGDIDETVSQAQKKYDDEGIARGGVCIININLSKSDNHYAIQFSQAGDVHAVLFDDDYKLRYESNDESIGHKVLNAVISLSSSVRQRQNGWDDFGILTKQQLSAQKGWRMALYSDGISNHFNAKKIAGFLHGNTSQDAIKKISSAVHKAMQKPDEYTDNCSIVIIDF